MSQVKLLKILNGLPKEMDSALDQITLNSFSVFGGPVLSETGLDLSNLKISNLADAIDSGDAINKGQLDLAVTPLTQYMENDIDRNSYRKLHVFENNAQVYADSSAAPVEDPSAVKRDGWYFKNESLGQKFNYYFYDPATQPEVTLGDTSLFAVMTFDAPNESPILAVYTRPTGTNDIIPGFAHSRRVYSGMTPAPVVGQKYLVYFGQEPTVFPELPRIQLALSTNSSIGDQDDSQLIMTVSIGSNSSSAAESVQFMMETLGFNSPDFKYTVDLRIRRASQKDLDALSSSLSQEAADRAAGDATLTADLAQEVSDRAAGDAAVQAAIDAVAADLAQAVLDSGNDNSGLQAALDQEIADRAAGDSALQSAVDAEKDRIDAILNASEADKDSFAEIVQLINSVDTENDNAFAAYVLSNDAALAQEVSDRAAADSALQAAIDAEEARALAAEAALQAEVDAEEARALAAEAAIAADLAQETADRAAGDSALQSAIDAEEARALAAEAALQAEVDAEEARALAAEAAIAADLAQEATDRAAGDSALDVRVSALEALPEGDEIQFYDSEELFPEIGDSERVYIAKDTNKVFRFDGIQGEGLPEWTVGSSGDFATIQDAIASPDVLDGHKLKVLPGTYTVTSRIIVNKEVIIYSDNKETAIFTGNTQNGIFEVNTNNVIISNLTIKQTLPYASHTNKFDSAIAVLQNTSNFKLLNSHIEFNKRGLVIQSSDYVAANNTFKCTNTVRTSSTFEEGIYSYGNSGTCHVVNNFFDVYDTHPKTSYVGINLVKSNLNVEKVAGKLIVDSNSMYSSFDENRLGSVFIQHSNSNRDDNDPIEYYITNNYSNAISFFHFGTLSDNISKIVMDKNNIPGSLPADSTSWGVPYNRGFIFGFGNAGKRSTDATDLYGNLKVYFGTGTVRNPGEVEQTFAYTQNPTLFPLSYFVSSSDDKIIDVSQEVPASPETPSLSIPQTAAGTGALEYIQLGITESELNSAVSVVQTALDQEIADRAAGDSALQAAIDAEEARALAAEAALQAEVDAEETRALAAEAALQAEVDAEEARALAAEAVLAADLAQEAADRAAGDSSLQSAIDAEKDRIDAILNASEADKDSFAEIVQLINSVDTENDNAFAAYVLSNDAALAQEVSDRAAGDAAVQAAIDAVAADLAQAILDSGNDNSGLQAALDQEIADRAAGDSALQSAIDAEEARALAAEAVLAADLAQEAADRAAAEAALQAEIDAEEARALAAEAALQAEIDAEEARALAAEGALDTRVSALEAGKDEAKNLEREFTASVALAAKDVVFISGADSVGKAQADALSNAMAIGFAKESADANASVMVINEGVVAGLSGLTPGQIYYLDPSSPGAITSTIPSGSGQIVLQLGIAKNSTELLIQKQFMYVVA